MQSSIQRLYKRDIKFTIEHPEQNNKHKINCLDLQITGSVHSGTIDWELYIKQSHSGVHLSYDFTLPDNVKKSVVVEQFRRAQKHSSTAEGREV